MSDESNQYDTLDQSYCYCYPAQIVLLGEGEVVYEPSVQPHHTTSEVYELGGIYITLDPDAFRFTFCHHCSCSIECCKKPERHEHQAQLNQHSLSGIRLAAPR